MSSKQDPLDLHGLDPSAIQATIEGKKTKVAKPMTEAEQARESRLNMKEKRLNTGRLPPMSESNTPAPEVEFDKSAAIDKIGAYRERFPFLKKRNNVTAKSLQSEIEDELHYIEKQLGSKDDSKVGGLIFCSAMSAVEHVHYRWNPLGLNLQGLGAIAQENRDEFDPILDEMIIKYGSQMYLGPEVRLCVALGGLLFTVHAANSGHAATASVLQRMQKTMKVPKTEM